MQLLFVHHFLFVSCRVPSPPGEGEFVEEVVALGQEAPLGDVRLHAHPVAPTLDVHLHAVQQVFDRRRGLPRTERHHRLLVRLQAVDGVVVATQVLFGPQHRDQDGGAACGDGLGSGDTNQNLSDERDISETVQSEQIKITF